MAKHGGAGMVSGVDIESIKTRKSATTKVTILTPDDEYEISWQHPPNEVSISQADSMRIPIQYDHLPDELEGLRQSQATDWEIVVTTCGETVSGEVLEVTPGSPDHVMFYLELY